MISTTAAERIAHTWIEDWNRHDLDAIMEHYADGVEFWSPMIVKRFGIASGKIEGKTQLRLYFAQGLAAPSQLHFTLLHLLVGVDSITIYFRRQDGAEAAEVMALDDQHRATMVRAHYTASSPVWQD